LPRDASIEGRLNLEAVERADIVAITVPFAAHAETLLALKPALQDKVLIDVVVPLNPAKVTRVSMPPEGSAAQQAQAILGENVRVVAAFHSVSYERLLTEDDVDCDILVCGGNKEARRQVLGLVGDAGLVGWDAGPIENAMVVEGLTSI